MLTGGTAAQLSSRLVSARGVRSRSSSGAREGTREPTWWTAHAWRRRARSLCLGFIRIPLLFMRRELGSGGPTYTALRHWCVLCAGACSLLALGGAQRQHRSEYRAGRSQALRKRMAKRRRPEECVLRGDEALRHGDGRSSTCRSTGFDLATPAAITLAACAQVRCLCPSLLVPARPTPRSPRLPYHSRYQVVLCQSPSYTKTTRPPLTLRPNPIRSN